jgi:hypothetical protein
MQHPTEDSAARTPEAARTARPALDPRQPAERHRAIGIAAVAAAVRYRGAPEPTTRASAPPR